MKYQILLLLLTLVIPVNAQDASIKWDYPIKPKTEEWFAIESYGERLKLLNIPEDLLEKLSTKELVRICLNYPQMLLVFTRENLMTGMLSISLHFNGFNELARRENAGVELINIYKNLSPEEYSSSGSIKKADFIYIELQLGKLSILENMSKDERFELLKISAEKYDRKMKSWEKLNGWELSANLWEMAQIYSLDNNKEVIDDEFQRQLKQFLFDTEIRDNGFASELINRIRTFISNETV